MKFKACAASGLVLIWLILTAGCAGEMTGMSRSEAGRGAGYDTLDLTIGVLPVSGSLNPEQNKHPGLATALDKFQFFKSVEPTASAPNRKFDLLLVCEPPGFAPEIKVLSGYSGKELFRKKITALYGTGGVPRAARELARAFAVGSPLYQEITAEREVYKRQIAAAPPFDRPQTAGRSSSDLAGPVFPEDRKIFGENDAAVIIGLERYQRLPSSDFSRADALLVKEYLVALGIRERNIELLTDEQATFSSMIRSVEAWLPNRVRKASRVFIYYSGHGSPDPVSGEAYLVPYDGDPNYLAETGYPLKRLYEKLAKLPVAEKMIVLDACFSGMGGRSVLAKGARPLVIAPGPASVPSDTAVLTASRGSEISASSTEKGQGLFTYYFLKALREGSKSLAEIYYYAKPRVEDEAKRLNVRQSPTLSPPPERIQGTFIFLK